MNHVRLLSGYSESSLEELEQRLLQVHETVDLLIFDELPGLEDVALD